MSAALSPALPGEILGLTGPAGSMACYVDGPPGAPPLLLIHSVNAAASAAEMRPLYLHYRETHRVYAPDLPGYGHSARPDLLYTPTLMVAALAAVRSHIRAHHPASPLTAIALSLGCEFLARDAVAAPQDYAALVLVSPTGFSGTSPREAAEGQTRGMPAVRRLIAHRPWSRGLFNLLTSRASIRYFLRKTWGRREIDEAMFEDAVVTARQPGAEHAPLCFLSGYLFSADIGRIYARLALPVLLVHGVRGDFVDYRQKSRFDSAPGWSFVVMDTGALPHFEQPERFVAHCDDFLRKQAAPPR